LKTLETIEELSAYIIDLLRNDFRDGLADSATAWSMMRKDGVPPAGIYFRRSISTDLAEYGFSILRAGLKLKELNGEQKLFQDAFYAAGKAFESLVRNAFEGDPIIGFYRLISGASYHLAGYSAIAYSILSKRIKEGENNAPCEIALVWLILRDLDRLREHIRATLEDGGDDAALAELLESGDFELEDVVSDILNNSICQGLAWFDLALATGEESLFDQGRRFLRAAVKLAADTSTVTLWWIAKLALGLMDELWESTLHVRLPVAPPADGEESYPKLRDLFITQLYCRKVAEVELWPSQLEAAARCGDITDDLIVALPTSAGKTRIAEMAALVTLSTEKRVLIVTPLRALSAQTERSFRKTFSPLGFSVSSLYGAGGLSSMDEDALKRRSIVIATPEKLDFALRNDVNILNDIGLIILDEGHMIGKTEREIRFEILVQRLLKRSDASERRIVCLSAILPEGQNLSDLTEWMRNDESGTPIKLAWRPTRQLFGTLEWRNGAATLFYDHKKEQPFIFNFVQQGKGDRQAIARPSSMHDLTIYGAWAFAQQGKKTLIFISQANWVEKFGLVALDLVSKGYLPNLLKEPKKISRCIAVGKEWLGAAHPAVKCLEVGMAIHHGGLPDPFLRELEMLIATDVITVTVASPTLSQGLNINAAVLLVPYLTRAGQQLQGEEFANVAGRAGRAFVDVEGIVLHIIYDKHEYRKRTWKAVVAAARHRTLTSGLMQVIQQAIGRLDIGGVLNRADAFEYLANSREAWFTTSNGEPVNDITELESDIDKLDAMILSLIEALDCESEELPALLDEALKGSFWERQIARESFSYKERQMNLLRARARVIWANTTPQLRKEHFCMGVGLDTGLLLDEMAGELNEALDEADTAALTGRIDELFNSLVRLAEPLFKIQPFKAERLPENWKVLLEQWVSGISIDLIGPGNVSIIEELFAYRLVWAIEAIKMRRLATGWEPEYITGGAAACAENGVPLLMEAMLIRAGLPSRRAAMTAIENSNADFDDILGMRKWIESDEVEELSLQLNWPSIETAPLWKQFLKEMLQPELKKWKRREFIGKKIINDVPENIADGIYRFEIDEDGRAWMATPDFKRIAQFRQTVNETGRGLTYIRYLSENIHPDVIRFGEGRLIWH
jgi:hypothetical protein